MTKAPADVSIFDKLGNVRADWDDHEIAALSEEQKELWAALAAARISEQDADAEVGAAMTDILVRVREADAVRQEAIAARPSSEALRLREIRRSIAANSTSPVHRQQLEAFRKEDEELAAKLAPLDAKLDAAEAAVTATRQRIIAARNQQKVARTAVANAVTAWQAQFAPITREALVRDMMARTQAHRAAIADGSFVPPPPVAPASALDALMSKKGRGGSTRRVG